MRRAMGRPALESARLELYKMGSRLERDLVPFLQKDVRQVLGGVRVNIPNKTKGQSKDLLSSARAILGKISKADVCLHYSLKNMPAGVRPFREFLLEAADVGVQAVLLVSGTGKKPKRDAVSCLRELAADLRESQLKLPRLGVAFSPFEDPEVEQARLKDKLSSGLVDSIWLQIGSDLEALRAGLEFLRDAAGDIRIYGSVFVPSRQLLSRFRERPWTGVDLTPNNYLESLENAEKVTQQILELYSEFGVLPLVESPVENATALRSMTALFRDPQDSLLSSPEPQGALETALALGDGDTRSEGLALMWFRVDLRVHDNPALTAAARHPELLPLYIAAEEEVGGAAQVWVKESLKALSATLESMSSRLCLRRGDVTEELKSLCRQLNVRAVYFNRRYEPWLKEADDRISRELQQMGVAVHSFESYLLYEPETISMNSGFHHGHWGTLLPFLGACRRLGQPRKPLPKPATLPSSPKLAKEITQPLEELHLAKIPPGIQDWSAPILEAWDFGEDAALSQMQSFVLGPRLENYEKQRSRADLEENPNSRLSPYLRWGQLSPHDLYWAVKGTGLQEKDVKTFQRRLFWRELAYFHYMVFPHMRHEPIRSNYKDIRWSQDMQLLKKWQRGSTGYPLVDAAMRELWQTGWCQQNMRMVVASFLVEYCNIDWVKGAEWYEDTLVDADIAINSMMWQNAGRSGIDQWNFVISPEGGSQDPSGAYVRRWVPELQNLPRRFLHKPWEAPADVLKAAGVVLGETYPFRCVSDLKGARQLSADAVLNMRRGIMNSTWNDAEGYDVISLPGGELTKVFTRREFRLPNSDAPKQRSRKRSPRRSASRSRSKVARRACQRSLANWVLRDPGRAVIDLDS